MRPKVSLLWVNYNSSNFKDVIEQSIESIRDLDYPNVELVAVDGCSTDDSPGYIERLLKKSGIDYKFIKQSVNLGLHSSWNVAYSAMSKKSKYFMMVNNDVNIYPNAIGELVERMEQDERVGALNGIELRWKSDIIDHTGMMFDEMLITNALSQGLNIKECDREEHVISVASSVLGIFRASAIKKLGSKLLEEDMVRHFNETILGARLWNAGYKILFSPIEVGEHYTKMITESRSPKRFYYAMRGWLTLLSISNSPYKNSPIKDSFALKWMVNYLRTGFSFKKYKEVMKLYNGVFIDSEQKAKNLIKRKVTVDIYKMPHIKGFRYYWFLPRGLTKMVQPTKTFKELSRTESLYIPKSE
ncbi:MAG: glycosyltransferase family 2 protein [Candidatus Aenigmarchaeota archaeon]|nr:glycosyltransferase family 2 protein [Candidatus Aenigmarchaeota archaeon]